MTTTPEDPTRLRTLKGLTALFKTITPDNGYQSDLSDFTDDDGETRERVFRGRVFFGDDDPIPMVAILENPRAEMGTVESPRGASVQHAPWDLLIQGFVDDDKLNPTDPAHVLMADVKKCLATERKKAQGGRARGVPSILSAGANLLGIGGVVDDIQFGGGVVRPPDETSAKAFFWLQVTLVMVEDTSNPFA